MPTLHGCYAWAAPLAILNLELATMEADRRIILPESVGVRYLGQDDYGIAVRFEDGQERRFCLSPKNRRTASILSLDELTAWEATSTAPAIPVLHLPSLDGDLPPGRWARFFAGDMLELFEGRNSLAMVSLRWFEPRRFATLRRAGLFLLQPFAWAFDILTFPVQVFALPHYMEDPI